MRKEQISFFVYIVFFFFAKTFFYLWVVYNRITVKLLTIVQNQIYSSVYKQNFLARSSIFALSLLSICMGIYVMCICSGTEIIVRPGPDWDPLFCHAVMHVSQFQFYRLLLFSLLALIQQRSCKADNNEKFVFHGICVPVHVWYQCYDHECTHW